MNTRHMMPDIAWERTVARAAPFIPMWKGTINKRSSPMFTTDAMIRN